jgi:phosphinothricin acetyltransferase
VTDAEVRVATEGDVAELNAIYNRYIVGSHVSFDTEPWTDEERLAWFHSRRSQGYPVLVATSGGGVVGASWAGPWRNKEAYRGATETTVVLAPDATGGGLGTVMLQTLIDALADLGFRTAIAVIALPNDASVALHRKLGYRLVGTLEAVGRKDGRDWDTVLMQRELTSGA